MFKNILNTTLVRIINTLISFVMLMISARMLGPQNLGTLGLILLAINIILLLNNLIGGGALVFLVPRYSLKSIAWISYLWVAVASVVGIAIFAILKVEPSGYVTDIFLLSLIFGINFVNQNILVGKGLIRYFNLITFVQYMLMFSLVILFFYGLKTPTIHYYLITMYISWSVNLVLGTIKVFSLIRSHEVHKSKGLLSDMLRYGLYVQIANLTQFFNYRLTYYFVESYLGRARLGLFEIGNKLADGVWLFGKSISLVQYSWIANAKAEDNPVELTLRLFKFSFILSFFLVAGMVILPESFYLFLFGAKYAGLHRVLVFLAPGIVFMASSMILAHFFAGIGKHYINTISSVIGLGAVALLCYLLIPRYGLEGAALAATITYLLSLLYNLIVFQAYTKIKLRMYLISHADFLFVKELMVRNLSRFLKSQS